MRRFFFFLLTSDFRCRRISRYAPIDLVREFVAEKLTALLANASACKRDSIFLIQATEKICKRCDPNRCRWSSK
jgi:hypothetical protein